ncbi:MAG: 16S rRNA (cytidine(1402)-2'-O)-methyltransferase [Alphaproteobacteria bacterium]|nr:16S rRNA (cytidine(1402)-2'-O)-methyltransferase [Alphaproteobacteria bacterium]
MSDDHATHDDDSQAQPIEKDRGWLLPAYDGRKLRAGLYLVATPIGNLRDISLRALDTLAAADIVACEDTRVTGKLLAHYGLSKKLLSYNDHSDDKRRTALVEAVASGKVVALVSDAGCPLVSDPGYKLVRAVQKSGGLVTSLPGASSVLSALQLSGLPSDRFTFLGFLPSKAQARCGVFEEWVEADCTLIVFETAPRLLKSLADIRNVFGERNVAVVRELTKMYEEVRCEGISALIEYYEMHGAPKGEIVLVIAPPEARDFSPQALEALLKTALGTMGTKDAAAHVAAQTGQSRKALYDLALKMAKNNA